MRPAALLFLFLVGNAIMAFPLFAQNSHNGPLTNAAVLSMLKDGLSAEIVVAKIRWTGYSAGRWTDDYTFVVETVGMMDKTWLDNAGRPHSGEMKVTEQFHRIDQHHMELTIDDPTMYKEPWLALNKFPLRLQPRGFDIREQYCSPSDLAEYNEEIGDPILTPHK